MYIYELSNEQVSDYVPIKFVLHEVFETSEEYQNNGISWQEPYVSQALSQIEGVSITAEFIDDEKTEIWGHGRTQDRKGMLQCADASVVGNFSKGYISEIVIDGKPTKVAMADGKLDYIRYGAFIDNYRQKFKEGKTLYGSVEIVGLPINGGEIKYKNDYVGDGRVPVAYKYCGFNLLGELVKQGDDSAIVTELNAKHNKDEGGKTDMTVEQMFKEVCDKITGEVNSLKAEIEASKEVTELNSKIVELNEKVESLNRVITEKDETISSLTNEINEAKSSKTELETQLAEIEKKSECNALDEKLKDFSDDCKKAIEVEINSFRENPKDCGFSVDDIVMKAKAFSFDSIKKENSKSNELNSFDTNLFLDISMPDESNIGNENDESSLFEC